MGRRKKRVDEKKLEGFRILEPVSDLLGALREESNPNRNLHFDHYVTLLLFYFFNPTLDSLRGLQASTKFKKVRRKLGIPRASLGSLSAAQHVFDAEGLQEVLTHLCAELPADKGDQRLSELKKVVTAVDGTLLKALPRITWALWQSETQRAAKAHVQFEVLRAAPSHVDVTPGNGSEKAVFENRLESGRLYVLDSGYAKFTLFQAVIDADSSFVCRLPTGWKHEVVEERALTDEDREARVTRDCVARLGSRDSRERKNLKEPVRLIEIERVEEPSPRMRSERPARKTITIVTDRLDLSAGIVALLYASRWKIEIFFRWLKCTLGCKHLVAESENGVALQAYAGLIACLLVSLWAGKKPTKRTFEAVCFYLQGLADEEEVLDHVKRLKPHT